MSLQLGARMTPSIRHLARVVSQDLNADLVGGANLFVPATPRSLRPTQDAQRHGVHTSDESLTTAPFVSATYSWSCVPGVTAGSLTDGGRGEGRETLQRVATEGP